MCCSALNPTLQEVKYTKYLRLVIDKFLKWNIVLKEIEDEHKLYILREFLKKKCVFDDLQGLNNFKLWNGFYQDYSLVLEVSWRKNQRRILKCVQLLFDILRWSVQLVMRIGIIQKGEKPPYKIYIMTSSIFYHTCPQPLEWRLILIRIVNYYSLT